MSKINLIKEISSFMLKEIDLPNLGFQVFDFLKDEFEKGISNFKELNKYDKEDLIRTAMNYEEKNVLEYTFEEILKWFKNNMPKNTTNIQGCVLKKQIEEKIELTHCFLDSNNKPLLFKEYPYRVVKTYTLSKDLEKQFSGKDMLILK